MRAVSKFVLTTLFTLLVCIPGVFGEKGGKKPPSFDPYPLSAGFDCSAGEPSVCSDYPSDFDRTGETSYRSAAEVEIDFDLALQGTVTPWNERYSECELSSWVFTVGEGRVVFRADHGDAMVRWGIDTDTLFPEAVNVRFYCKHENFDDPLPFEGGTSIECKSLLLRFDWRKGRNSECFWVLDDRPVFTISDP